MSWEINIQWNNETCPYHRDRNGKLNMSKCNNLDNKSFYECTKDNCPLKV